MFAHQFVEMQMTARLHGWTEFITMVCSRSFDALLTFPTLTHFRLPPPQQNYYCASYREEEREMLPACIRMGVASIPWSPLGGGILARPIGGEGVTSRNSTRKLNEVEQAVNKAVEAVAKRNDVTMAQAALAWCLKHPAVYSPIVGISSARSLDDAIKSVHVKLSESDIKEIEDAYKPMAISGHS